MYQSLCELRKCIKVSSLKTGIKVVKDQIHILLFCDLHGGLLLTLLSRLNKLHPTLFQRVMKSLEQLANYHRCYLVRQGHLHADG